MLQSRCPLGMQSPRGATRGGVTSKPTHVAVDKSQVLTDCWPETSVPYYLHLSKGLTQQLASFRVRTGEAGGWEGGKPEQARISE